MLKTRKHLEPAGRCVLCNAIGRENGAAWDIKHERDCLLADPGVIGIRMTAVRSRVVIRGPRQSDGKYWWTSTGSGKTYDIERRGTYWVMVERISGKPIMDDARLCDIRERLQAHQGNL